MESQLATLATDTGTTFAKLFQVEAIQTILFKFWAFRVYTLNNLTPIRLFCVKGRFSGLSGIKTDHVWPEIRPLGFKGLEKTEFNSGLWLLQQRRESSASLTRKQKVFSEPKGTSGSKNLNETVPL